MNDSGGNRTIDLGALRAESVEMLRVVTSAFDDQGLVYWLDFGTLLGAVRHQRTLYWDGDFDLSTLDPNMLNYSAMWDRIRDAGYTVLRSAPGEHEYVKVYREGNTIGQFRVDLHRYERMPSGTAEFIVSYKRGWIAAFLLKIRNLISISMPAGSEQAVAAFKIKHFTSYHKICKSVLESGVPPEELESLDAIEYRHGKLNSNMDFELVHPRFHVRQYPLADASPKTKAAVWVLQKLPNWLKRFGCSLCETLAGLLPKTPDKKSVIPLGDVETLTQVQFHDLTYHSPSNVEDYLAHSYGDNWRVPVYEWETDTDFEGKKTESS